MAKRRFPFVLDIIPMVVVAVHFAFTLSNFSLYIKNGVLAENTDYYIVYQSRQIWCSFAPRTVDLFLNLSSHSFDRMGVDTPEAFAPGGLGAYAAVLWEMILLDFVLGSFFWLVVAVSLVAVVRHKRLKRPPPSSMPGETK